ncbi:hypothetical protein GCM10023235_31240 [Kitasatospora terrestris]|uniref:Uncharacterized protein n=1 Tax=Kitasatospora terrestris TaxID=258051 RepID=A0ABP9DSI6_9ACTN
MASALKGASPSSAAKKVGASTAFTASAALNWPYASGELRVTMAATGSGLSSLPATSEAAPPLEAPISTILVTPLPLRWAAAALMPSVTSPLQVKGRTAYPALVKASRWGAHSQSEPSSWWERTTATLAPPASESR